MRDLDDISTEVKNAVKFVPVTSFEQIIPIALDGSLKPNSSKNELIVNNKTTKPQVITQ